jgi:hypothetical protein
MASLQWSNNTTNPGTAVRGNKCLYNEEHKIQHEEKIKRYMDSQSISLVIHIKIQSCLVRL